MRHSGEALSIFKLEGNAYAAQAESSAFPDVAASLLTEFLQGSPDIALPELVQRVQKWIRARHAG